MSAMGAIVRKELRDAARSRWLVGFAVTFALTALALSLAQGRGGDAVGQGFTRTTAGLVNLCLLLVPLLAVALGAGSVAGERERATLASLLSQPISATELLLAKYVGLLLAVWAAIALGFGTAGVVLALVSPMAGMAEYFQFTLLSAGLAATMLSLGMLISVWSDGRMKALAMAIVLWFVLVLFYDFAAIGLALSVSMSGRTLLLAVLANPVEAARILAIVGLEPDLRVLGPMGSYLVNELGLGATVGLLLTVLIAWSAVPLALAARVFARQDC